MEHEEWKAKRAKCLVINRSDSKCGGCDRNADPSATTHDVVWTYQGDQPGCGLRWEYVSSNYTNMEQFVAPSRPDLEWIS